MVTAISAATLLSLAAILPAAVTATISLADLTTIPVLVNLSTQPLESRGPTGPYSSCDAEVCIVDPPTDKEPTVTVNRGSGPAEVIPPPGD